VAPAQSGGLVDGATIVIDRSDHLFESMQGAVRNRIPDPDTVRVMGQGEFTITQTGNTFTAVNTQLSGDTATVVHSPVTHDPATDNAATVLTGTMTLPNGGGTRRVTLEVDRSGHITIPETSQATPAGAGQGQTTSAAR